MAAAFVQYRLGEIRMAKSFGHTFTRKESPRAFWFWLTVWVLAGLLLTGRGVAGLLWWANT